MNLIKASTKPMVQGRSTGNDLKKIIFSHHGQFYISIDRNFHAILWSVAQQTIIKEFDDALTHYGSFSPNDDRLFIIGRQKLYIFQIKTQKILNQSKNNSLNLQNEPKKSSLNGKPQINVLQNSMEKNNIINNVQKSRMSYSLKQVKRFENGFFMGSVQCSPNNLYFAYTNSSQLYIRDMVNYERIFHIPYLNNTSLKKQQLPQVTQVSSSEIHKFSQSCSPFFVKFNYKTGDLYTVSLNEGDICKWGITQLESQINSLASKQQSLSQQQKNNMKKYPIYVKVKNSLSSIISDIDFSDTHLLVSSDRNRRKLFILNQTNLQIQAIRTMPKTFFLDFNTEIQSTYSYQNNVIISIAVPGDFLFIHNGASFAFIKSQQLEMNIYTLEYSKIKNILSLGGQVASRQDQIIFYNIQNGLNKQCPQGQYWQNSSQKCQKLPCSTQQSKIGVNPFNKNQCKCQNPYEEWNPLYKSCVLDCSLIQNSFDTGFFPSIFKQIQSSKINYCPCKQGYKWNYKTKKCEIFSCRSIEGGNGRLNYPFSINQCKCDQHFSFDVKTKFCVLNCQKVQNAVGQSFFKQVPTLNNSLNVVSKSQVQSCNCKNGFYWNQRIYSCVKQETIPITPKDGFNKTPIPQPNFPNPIVQKSIQFPIAAVIIPLVIILIIIGITAIFCYRYRKSKKSKQQQNKEKNKNSNDIQIQFDSYMKNKKSKSNKNKDLNNAVVVQTNIQLQQNFHNGQNNFHVIKQDQLDENEYQNQLSNNNNNNNQYPSTDQNTTKRRKRRKMHRIDKQKTTKNVKDIQQYQDNQDNDGIASTDRPIINVHRSVANKKGQQNSTSANKTNKSGLGVNNNKNNTNEKNIQIKNSNGKSLNLNNLPSLELVNYLKPLKEQSSTSHAKSSSLFSKSSHPCQLCFQNDANCFTKCQHYFHLNCLKQQFDKMKEKHKNNKKQCPSCWQILQNQQDDIYMCRQDYIKNQNNDKKRVINDENKQKKQKLQGQNNIKKKISKKNDKTEVQDSLDIDQNDVNFSFDQDKQSTNQ